MTRDTVREVQEELQSVQGNRIRQQDIWGAVRFAQQRLHIADVYDAALRATLEEWDQARRIWLDIWNSGQQFSQSVGWSRREWRYITYQFLQVVGPWIVTALLTLRHQGEGLWVDETVRSITGTLGGMVSDISMNPEPFARVTTIMEPMTQRIAEELAKSSRKRLGTSPRRLLRRSVRK